jgi:hypothetical protein
MLLQSSSSKRFRNLWIEFVLALRFSRFSSY